MGKIFEKLDAKLISFIKAQKMFFVASAPMLADGHVNMSPKGYDSFAVLDDMTVAYLDMGGSGIETLAHVKDNGRITIMFCAFEGKANILRLYGKASAVSFDEPGFDDMLALFPNYDHARTIFKIHLTRIQDSCGWGVPFYDFKGEREQLVRYIDNFSRDDWIAHRRASNMQSIDGLDGLTKPKI